MASQEMEVVKLTEDIVLAVWLEEEVVSLDDKPGWFCALEAHDAAALWPYSVMTLGNDYGPFESQGQAMWIGKAMWRLFEAQIGVTRELLKDWSGDPDALLRLIHRPGGE